jgi:uncharacterized protein (DUF1330 family)
LAAKAWQAKSEEEQEMATFIVFTRLRTKDQAQMEIYSQKGAGAVAGHNLTAHVFYGKQTIVEGPAHEGIVVMSFPSRAEAEAWYNSPAYQEAKRYRNAGADYSVTIVDGL